MQIVLVSSTPLLFVSMIDKTAEITAFLKEHYSPGTVDNTEPEFQLNNSQILEMLFNVFPIGSIDDYGLHQILTNLGYVPQKRSHLEFIWCLKERV